MRMKSGRRAAKLCSIYYCRSAMAVTHSCECPSRLLRGRRVGSAGSAPPNARRGRMSPATACRRAALWVACHHLSDGALLGSPTTVRQAQGQSPQRFDLRIENGPLAGNLQTIRVYRNDPMEINWSADRRTVLHLHGYDINKPDKVFRHLS